MLTDEIVPLLVSSYRAANLGDSVSPRDHYVLLVHLKGMCLRTLGFPLQAEECYLEVLEK